MIVLKIATVLIAIIAVAFTIAIFTKKKYNIKREVVVNAPQAKVYDYVRLHKNQKDFNHWLSFDPDTKINITGSTDGTPGSILHFESNHKKVGTGEWENVNMVPNERIDLELRFLKPYVFTASGNIQFQAQSDNKTNIVWNYYSGMNWPKNFMLLLMDMDKIIGKDIEATLNKIKVNTETQSL